MVVAGKQQARLLNIGNRPFMTQKSGAIFTWEEHIMVVHTKSNRVRLALVLRCPQLREKSSKIMLPGRRSAGQTPVLQFLVSHRAAAGFRVQEPALQDLPTTSVTRYGAKDKAGRVRQGGRCHLHGGRHWHTLQGSERGAAQLCLCADLCTHALVVCDQEMRRRKDWRMSCGWGQMVNSSNGRSVESSHSLET